jgi:lycopene cyclase domain-containing protein
MTYFAVLLRFVVLPTVILALIAAYHTWRGGQRVVAFRTWPGWAAVGLHVVVAVTYTTPWDNYLVAQRVWWYDPALVNGLTLGWVPIEEYLFFVTQTLMTGLWLLLWMRRLDAPPALRPVRTSARWISTAVLGVVWLAWLGVLLAGWMPGRYMALILVWALPPIMLQTAFGGDLLWRYRRLVSVGLGVPTLYLWIVDALAIRSGTWTISPEHTLGIELAGVLPIEEAVFFLVTNTLIVFGITLLLARESRERIGRLASRWT